MRLTTADDTMKHDPRIRFQAFARPRDLGGKLSMNGQYIELLRAHRNNIRRYRRLLETPLTNLERRYIERRVQEERSSVERLVLAICPERVSVGLEKPRGFKLEELLHPVDAFNHPFDIVDDRDLTLYEKRALLSSWLADHCACNDGADLTPVAKSTSIELEDIVEALCELSSSRHPAAGDQQGTSHHVLSRPHRPEDARRIDRC